MLIELGLGSLDCQREVIVIEGRIQDFVAVVLEVDWLYATWDGVPAVEEKDFHRADASRLLRQFGQYHGAGIVTAFGLRL